MNISHTPPFTPSNGTPPPSSKAKNISPGTIQPAKKIKTSNSDTENIANFKIKPPGISFATIFDRNSAIHLNRSLLYPEHFSDTPPESPSLGFSEVEVLKPKSRASASIPRNTSSTTVTSDVTSDSASSNE